MSWRVMEEWIHLGMLAALEVVGEIPCAEMFDAADALRETASGQRVPPHGFGGEDLPEPEPWFLRGESNLYCIARPYVDDPIEDPFGFNNGL